MEDIKVKDSDSRIVITYEDYKDADMIKTTEGRFPEKDNEIAISVSRSKMDNKYIGDSIVLEYNGIEKEYIITGTVYNGSKAIHLSNNIVTISTIYPYLPSNGLNQTVVSVRPFYYRQRTANSRYMKKVDVTSLMNFEVSCGKDPVRSNYGITGASGMIESDNYEAHTIELFLGSSVTMTCPYRPVDDEGTSTEVSVSDMAKNYLNYDIEIHGIYRSL